MLNFSAKKLLILKPGVLKKLGERSDLARTRPVQLLSCLNCFSN